MGKRFTVNTDRQNRNGYAILTKGMDLTNFKKNPVMLRDHRYSILIGRWEDLRIETDGTLTAEAVFAETEAGKEVKTLVEQGILKATSTGIRVIEMETRNGQEVITKCELFEISMVSIPANTDTMAVQFYDKNNQAITQQQMLNNFTNQHQPNTPHTMNETNWLQRLGAKLGLTPNADGSQIEQTLNDLQAKNQALEADNKTLQASLDEVQAQLENEGRAAELKLVEQAIEEGKITPDKKQDYLDLAKSNLGLAKEVLGNMPGKASLTQQTQGGTPKEQSFEEMRKQNPQALKELWEQNPEEYARLVKQNTTR